jgi:hypothetical protein
MDGWVVHDRPHQKISVGTVVDVTERAHGQLTEKEKNNCN